MATKLSYSLFKDLSLVYLLFVRDKTMNDKLMYIPNNEIQNETSFVKMDTTMLEPTNLNSIKVPKVLEPTHRKM